MGVIYSIAEKSTNKIVYIGQTINYKQRYANHKSTVFNTKHPAYHYPLYRAMRKYGWEYFIFDIICTCPNNELDEKEKYYIDLFDTYYNGYNLTLGGRGR